MHTRFFIIHIYKSVCIHGTAQSLPLPSLKNCVKKMAGCGLYIAHSVFVLVSTVIFFLGVALFFSDFIRRGVFKLFLACSFWWFYLICLLSSAFPFLFVVLLGSFVSTLIGYNPDMIGQDALGGNAKAIMVRGTRKVQNLMAANWFKCRSIMVIGLCKSFTIMSGRWVELWNKIQEKPDFFQKILHFLGRW